MPKKVPKITLDELFGKYHELLESNPKQTFILPRQAFEAIREATRRVTMEDRELLKVLEEQIKEDCSDFIFYDLAIDRPGPEVTVYLAELNKFLGDRFVRAVAICTRRDPPSRVKGRIEAAKRLLRAIKNGIAIINPTEDDACSIAEELEHRGLITMEEQEDSKGNTWFAYAGGDCNVEPTEQEKIWWEAHKANRAKAKAANKALTSQGPTGDSTIAQDASGPDRLRGPTGLLNL